MAAPPTVDEFARRGGEAFEQRFNRTRVVVIFTLGCALIVYSVLAEGTNIPYIIVGAVLIGLVPVDQWLQRMPRSNGNGGNGGGNSQD